jgi:hypothetical protein
MKHRPCSFSLSKSASEVARFVEFSILSIVQSRALLAAGTAGQDTSGAQRDARLEHNSRLRRFRVVDGAARQSYKSVACWCGCIRQMDCVRAGLQKELRRANDREMSQQGDTDELAQERLVREAAERALVDARIRITGVTAILACTYLRYPAHHDDACSCEIHHRAGGECF